MKDTKILWIGDIPDDWDVIKVKYNCSLKGRIGWQGLTTDEYLDEGPFLITGTDFKEGTINWDSCVHVSDWRWEQAPEIQVKEGDLLITKDGTVGKVAIVSCIQDKTTLNSGVLVIRPTETSYETKFLYYVLKSEEFWKWFNYINSGSTTISHLYQHDLNHFYFAIAPLPEQRNIVAFLDKKCERIDRIIERVKKQIGILTEMRISEITSAVVNGVRSNVEKKASKVEWIGKIPNDWTVVRLKYLTNQIVDGTHSTPTYVDEGVPFLRVTDITGNEKDIDLDSVARISNQEHRELLLRCKPEKGDLLVSKNGTIGVPKVIDWDWEFSIFVSLCLLKLKKQISAEYLYYYFKSNIVNTEIAFKGTTNTITNLHLEKIRNFYIPLPTKDEQKEIVDYLNKKCEIIDSIIKKKEKELKILEAHKTSIISEYITGKKRVSTIAKEV